MKEKIKKTCPQCGKEFEVTYKNRNKKFCEVKCYRLSRRTDKTRICQNPACGKEYTISKAKLRDVGGSKAPGKKYCSRPCRDEARNTRIQKECEVCGKTFEVRAHRKDTATTCSPKCSGVRKSRMRSLGKLKDAYSNAYSGVYVSKSGKKCGYDSAWELLRMHQLDASDFEWERDHGIVIPYVDVDGERRSYVPDLLVSNGTEKWLEEIKPKMKLEDESVKRKHKAAESLSLEGIGFRVVTEVELGVKPSGMLITPISGATYVYDLLPKGQERKRGQKRSAVWRSAQEVCERYLKGETLDQLAKDYGCTSGTVASVLKDNDVKIRPTSTPKGVKRVKQRTPVWNHQEEICRRYKEGENLSALGRHYGCSGATIRSILIENGVERRSGRKKKK